MLAEVGDISFRYPDGRLWLVYHAIHGAAGAAFTIRPGTGRSEHAICIHDTPAGPFPGRHLRPSFSGYTPTVDT